MGLSRLDNFLKSTRGNILYVNPNDLDATDSIENQGNSLTRPFKTIQRALVEASRFSYQKGLDNDRFGKTTVLLYPGEHVLDNRPGWIPDGTNNFRLRNGTTSDNLPPFDLTTNFDLDSPNNELYKLNSIHGGVILPRGTSLVGLDLRKTKIRPKYVPNPTDDNLTQSAIFRITGACYFWQFTTFDGDETGTVYTDPTNFSATNRSKPTFSHHKLTVFEYADGINTIDEYSNLTDLDIYYSKLTKNIDGEIEAGPNAVFAFAKEGYKWTNINLKETYGSLSYGGMLKLGKKYFKTGIKEMYRSLNKKAFVNEINKLVPGVNKKDIKVREAGVRAQAVDKDGKLVDDFMFQEGLNSLHVLNAPSPAATASLAIGEHIASKVLR